MKNFRGLSLVELLIGLTVASIAGVLIVNLFTSANQVFVDQSITVNQGLSLNNTAREITDLVKSSNGVAEKYPVSGTPQYTSGNNVLVLKLPALSASGAIIDSVFDYAVVSKDDSNPKILRKKIFKDAVSSRNNENRVLSTSLGKVTFDYLDSNNNSIAPLQAVRVGFTINLSENAGLSSNESSSSGIVNIKNL